MAASSHLLHHVCGSRTNWERPSEAVKAKGHASSMRKDTSSRRTGNTVTDISPTCRGRTKVRRVTADEAVPIQSAQSYGSRRRTRRTRRNAFH